MAAVVAALAVLLLVLAGCRNDDPHHGLQTSSRISGSSTLSNGNAPGRPPGQAPTPFPGRGRVPFLPPAPPPPPEVIEPTFGGAGGSFLAPVRISSAEGGWLLVTDSKRSAVLRVDPQTLAPDQALAIHGTPLAVGMLGEEIFVGVKDSKALEIRSYRGARKGYLAAPGAIGYPSDLAIDAGTGLLFALDGLARTVQVYRIADRALLGTIGGGVLRAPSGITLDAARKEVLVSDYGATNVPASVHFLSYATETFGQAVGNLSGAGDCTWFGCSGGFSRPRGAAARNGRVYLPDAIHGQVLVYDRDTLALLSRLGAADPALRELRLPSDAWVTATGDVLVTSTYGREVVRFAGVAP